MSIEDFDPQYLKSKTILITGVSKGIGKALCEKLLDLGNIVIGTSRELSDLEEISLKFPRNFYPYSLELENINQITTLAEYIEKDFDKLDVLFNNAGILGQIVTLEKYDFDVWKKVININLNNQFYLTQRLLKLIKKSKKGSIVNVSSSVGRFPRETWGAYSISKSGLEALTEILSQELYKENIIVNSVNPGGTATFMRKEAYPEEDQSELPTADDILPIFLYLASDEAKETGMKYNAREYIGSL